MNEMKIEGIATFTEKSFHFDSGMPVNEPVISKALNLHGTLKVSTNACADWEECRRIYLPPEVHNVTRGEGYNVRRTSRHYIIQLKVPIVESRKESEERINDVLPTILGDIVLDRRELWEE